MRNLKRVLSLALAVVMVIGMMVMTTGAADFTDTDEITFTTAVDALSTLNVINGRDDGSFDPTGSVTRAEMAKMICIVHNGGKDPLLGAQITSTFTDTVGHWAESYIAYATNLGIIKGMGDGTFAPDAKVTGTQAAKMLLVALGYDPDVFALVGTEWDTTTEVIANGIDLFDGLEGTNLSVALNREKAAQMIYNALNAHIMVKSYDKVLSNGEISYNYVLSETKTLLNDTYGAYKVEGVVWGNEYATLTTGTTKTCETDGETVIEVTNRDEINAGDLYVHAANTRYTFKVSTGAEELGKAVILYVKPAQTTTNAYKATVIGEAIMAENTVMTKDNEWKAPPMMSGALKKAGLKDDLTDALVFNNGVLLWTDTLTVDTDNDGINDATDGKCTIGVENTVYGAMGNALNANGYYTQFIDNDLDGYVDIVLVDKVDFGKVTYYNTAKDGSITISTGASPVKYNDSADVVGFEDVAKNDFVIYQEIGGRLYVEKAQTASGTLTEYSKQVGDDEADSNLWIDGEKFTNSGVAGDNCEGYTVLVAANRGDTVLQESGVFYFDACGYIVAIDATAPNKYAIATYASNTAHTGDSIVAGDRAQTYFEDGTTSAPVYAAVDDDGNAAPAYSAVMTTLLGNGNDAQDAVLGKYSYNMRGELVLDNTGKLLWDETMSDLEYTSGNVLVTVGGSDTDTVLDADANGSTGGNRVYMTDKTVVYFVETKGNASDITNKQVGKVTTFVGKDNVPSFKLDASGDPFDVQYFVNARNEIEAMAIISSSINTVGNHYLYVIEVASSTSKTKDVKVVVDGEVTNVTVNSLSGSAIPTHATYEYTVDKDGNYDLYALSNTTGLYLIEKVNPNERTIVVNGIEYKVADSTDIANVADKEAIAYENLVAGDVVNVLFDGNSSEKIALGVYVREAYDAANASIVGARFDPTSTTAGVLTAFANGTKTNRAAKGHFDINAQTSLNDTQLMSSLAISGGATATLYSDFACTSAASGALTVATEYYVKVVSETGDTINIYEIEIAAAFSNNT